MLVRHIVEAARRMTKKPAAAALPPILSSYLHLLLLKTAPHLKRQVDEYDWEEKAEDRVEKFPTGDVLAAQLEEEFWEDQGEALLRGAIADHAADELLRDALQRDLHVRAEVEDEVSQRLTGDELEIGFQVVGETADMDNADEAANFDHEVDAAILRALPRARISHDFVRAWTSDHHFMWRVHGGWRVPLRSTLHPVVGVEVRARARAAAARAR